MQSDPNASLFAKIARVMAQVQTFSKDGEFRGGRIRFNFASATQVFDVIRPIMAENNLVCIPSIVSKTIKEHGDNEMVTVKFIMTLCDGETGATHSTEWENEVIRYGNDDKIVNKAMTISLKYFLMSLFVVSQGDSDEDTTAPPQTQSRNQQTRQQTSQGQNQHWSIEHGQPAIAKVRDRISQYGKFVIEKAIETAGDLKQYETPTDFYNAIQAVIEQETQDEEPAEQPEPTKTRKQYDGETVDIISIYHKADHHWNATALDANNETITFPVYREHVRKLQSKNYTVPLKIFDIKEYNPPVSVILTVENPGERNERVRIGEVVSSNIRVIEPASTQTGESDDPFADLKPAAALTN